MLSPQFNPLPNHYTHDCTSGTAQQAHPFPRCSLPHRRPGLPPCSAPPAAVGAPFRRHPRGGGGGTPAAGGSRRAGAHRGWGPHHSVAPCSWHAGRGSATWHAWLDMHRHNNILTCDKACLSVTSQWQRVVYGPVRCVRGGRLGRWGPATPAGRPPSPPRSRPPAPRTWCPGWPPAAAWWCLWAPTAACRR